MHRCCFAAIVAIAPLFACAPTLAQQIDPNIQLRIERELERQGLSKRIIEKPEDAKPERKALEKKERRSKKKTLTEEQDD